MGLLAWFAGGVLLLGWVFRQVVWRPLRELTRVCAAIPAGGGGEALQHGHGLYAGLARQLQQLAEEHTRLRNRISAEEINHHAILSSMVEGVMVVDRARRIRLVNESFLELFELRASPVGTTILRAVREAAVDEIMRTALESGLEQSREISLSLTAAADGEERFFEVSAVPLKSDGEEGGAVAVFHDISRLRRLEELRREFVANVSHELRTPLSIISGYIETLTDTPMMPRKEQAVVFSTIERHAQRLKALLDDLLTLARLESRDEKMEVEPLEVAKLLRQLVKDWKVRLARKNISITDEVSGTVPELLADGFRLEQVFNNLLENAYKYTPEGGQITVGAWSNGQKVELSVRDTGIGIPPADLPHIFERFYRVEKARSREAGGTGLGLSIVKHIAALHGGTVRAESNFGAGTVITLCLPLVPPGFEFGDGVGTTACGEAERSA